MNCIFLANCQFLLPWLKILKLNVLLKEATAGNDWVVKWVQCVEAPRKEIESCLRNEAFPTGLGVKCIQCDIFSYSRTLKKQMTRHRIEGCVKAGGKEIRSWALVPTRKKEGQITVQHHHLTARLCVCATQTTTLCMRFFPPDD